MKIEIKIPDIAENVESGIVAGILVSKGDHVEKDQPVVEVETDKAATDIPSTHSGTVDEIRVEEGDEVKVNQVIMILESDEKEESEKEEKEEKVKEEEEEEEKEEKEEEEEKEEKEEKVKEEEEEEEEEEKEEKEEEEEEEEKEEGEEEEEEEEEAQDEKARRTPEDVPASPAVRRMAREAGIDLAEVEGTGPHERITMEDVESLIRKKEEKAPEEAAPEEPGRISRQALSTIRKLTAERMQESWQEIPHVTQFDEADITGMEEFRQKNKDAYKAGGGNLTLTAILLKISAFALQRFPRFNTSLDEEGKTLQFKQDIHIGVAVDTERGLLVPVIRDVDRKSLKELSVELTDVSERARNKKIKPDELQGGTFTVSNLGGIGGTAFTPIVYSPQAAILGVSRGSFRQVYREGEFRKRLVLPLSLSYDHRIVDGAEGARFLRWICEVLEDPYALMQ